MRCAPRLTRARCWAGGSPATPGHLGPRKTRRPSKRGQTTGSRLRLSARCRCSPQRTRPACHTRFGARGSGTIRRARGQLLHRKRASTAGGQTEGDGRAALQDSGYSTLWILWILDGHPEWPPLMMTELPTASSIIRQARARGQADVLLLLAARYGYLMYYYSTTVLWVFEYFYCCCCTSNRECIACSRRHLDDEYAVWLGDDERYGR